MAIVQGLAYWVKATEGKQEKYDEDDKFAAWTMQLVVDEVTAKTFENKGVSVGRDKVTGEPFIRFKRKEGREEYVNDKPTGNIIKMDPPKAVDENLNPIDANTIGNGSPCYVDYWVSTPRKKSYKPSLMWEGIQVDSRTMNVYQSGLSAISKPLGAAPVAQQQVGDDGIPF